MPTPSNPDEGGASPESRLMPGYVDWDEAFRYANNVIDGLLPNTDEALVNNVDDEDADAFVDARLLHAASEMFDDPNSFHDFVATEGIKESLKRMRAMGPVPLEVRKGMSIYRPGPESLYKPVNRIKRTLFAMGVVTFGKCLSEMEGEDPQGIVFWGGLTAVLGVMTFLKSKN